MDETRSFHGLEVSSLGILPQELLIKITTYLAPESAASLTLSCCALYLPFEAQHVRRLKQTGSNAVLYGFLLLLERDLPNHILCKLCCRLHSTSSAASHLPSRREGTLPSMACWDQDKEFKLRKTIHNDFSSTIFRMAMKSHVQGHDTTDLINRLSYKTETVTSHQFTEQRTAIARIEKDTLLIREQMVFMIRSSGQVTIPWYIRAYICLHIKFRTMWDLSFLGIEVPLPHEIDDFRNKAGVICCGYCHTEFRVDFKGCGDAGNAMVVTKWMDLGDGRDLLDQKWTTRCSRRIYKKSKGGNVEFPGGSICAAFEQMESSDFEYDAGLKLGETDETVLGN